MQSTLAVLLERGHFERGLPLERIAAVDRGHAGAALSNPPQRRDRAGQRRRSDAGGLERIAHTEQDAICINATL